MSTSNTKQALTKQAVDSNAEGYWEDYYKDSGYGKLWVRKIPMRVKAELTKRAGKTAAQGTPVEPRIRPLTTVVTDTGVHLEGLAIYGQGEARNVTAFVADFNHDGDIVGFDSVVA